MKTFYFKISEALSKLNDLPLLLIRLVLAYGFYVPAMMKLDDVGAIAEWFDSLGVPAPTFNAYLATFTEAAGVLLLSLGLGTRLIAIPLMVTMLVAIKTVHWENGFNASDNGYEIPLYYLVMLLLLLCSGPGRLSLDHLIARRLKK